MNTISIIFLLWTDWFSHKTDIQGHNKNLISSFVPSIFIFTPSSSSPNVLLFQPGKIYPPSRPSPHTYPAISHLASKPRTDIIIIKSTDSSISSVLLSSSPRQGPFLRAVAALCLPWSHLYLVSLTTRNRIVKGNVDFTTGVVHDSHSICECLSFQKHRSATYFV